MEGGGDEEIFRTMFAKWSKKRSLRFEGLSVGNKFGVIYVQRENKWAPLSEGVEQQILN